MEMDTEELEIEAPATPSITDEEAAFLNTLDDGVLENLSSANEDELKSATDSVLMLLNAAEGLTKNLAHPNFAWKEQEKLSAAQQIAPAFAKHGGQLPEWLEPYKEEVIAVFAISTLAFGSYLQIKELKAAETQNAA